jgi:heme oxygenase
MIPDQVNPPIAPVLIRLKRDTADLHQQVEHRFRILDPALTRQGYVQKLERLLGLHRPLEALIEPWGDRLVIDWDARRKTHLLQADLEFLGKTPAEIAQLPHCEALPSLDDLGAVLGCLYVLEGSTLGGRMIAGHLAQHLGVVPGQGASFFSSYGEALMPRWRSFQHRLAELATSAAMEDRIVQSAQATFTSFGNWMAAA